MSKISNVWVFSDSVDRYADLLAGAHQLGERVNAVIWNEEDAAQVAQADAIYLLEGKTDQQRIENYAETLATLVQSKQKTLVILAATRRGKALAAKLSVLLHSGLVNDAIAMEYKNGTLYAEHRMYGGLAFGREALATSIVVATIASGIYEPLATATAHPPLTKVTYVQPEHEILCKERQAKTVSSLDLSKARRVIGIGRGLMTKDDLHMIRELASALDAEIGCSRPIAEGEHWMARERYIGVSGILLKSDIYLALGISGQIQHMVGGNGAKTIIAVNKDKNAPIFQYADYGLIGDIYKVVPKLTALLKR
ncbi:FAD-binding protein [Escherichia albertii]|uniref:FAD-binding protein n=1 Tax=Escherichia albertii TaxID=208962 RepID=UPI00074428A3|nr:FAD-binding protein [Escherichia albertii]EEU9596201.1 electron transfer flavoprotein subunit alpha [Escherichia albertii]EGQ0032425.1 electron transfer flavoprotein subunit alpha [Escherichia albertii]EHW5310205.1 FAD-binding protein [Escherichia albertii]MCZ8823251.1 FAD-binding protein [Escherichia albertii]MCZ8875174.1 FAD-binding protein [Escherichia albertii]